MVLDVYNHAREIIGQEAQTLGGIECDFNASYPYGNGLTSKKSQDHEGSPASGIGGENRVKITLRNLRTHELTLTPTGYRF